MDISFEETQKFTQWWVWALLIGGALISIYGVYKQMILGEQFGNNPLSNYGLWLLLLPTLGAIGLFAIMQLRTKINNETIRIEFSPFTKKEIKWKDIEEAEVINYGFVGGWGIRTNTKYGTVYNISGNTGLSIKLKNGKKICIGTQKETELKEVIKEASRQQKI